MNTGKKRKRLALAALSLLLLCGWWGYGQLGPDPQAERARQLKAQLGGEAARKLSPEKRRELWKEYGNQVKQLSPAQRRELAREGQKAFQKRLADYFALPKAQQTAQLDQQINQMEARRKEWERNAAAQKGPATGAEGKGGWGAKSAEERDRARKQRLDESTPEERAQRAEYFRQLNQRRQQRGLGPLTFGRRT